MKYRIFTLLAVSTLLLGMTACSGQATLEPSAVPATVTPVESVLEPTAPPEPTPTPLQANTAPAAPQPVAFSYATPDSQGLSTEALERLVKVVQGYVEEDKIVGAELVVIKNRQIVLHEAVGWKDRDAEIPMAC